MRLEKLQAYMKEKGWDYRYTEENDCASLDWIAHGLKYHVWEYPDGGAESNIASGGKMEEFSGDYEEELLKVLMHWK